MSRLVITLAFAIALHAAVRGQDLSRVPRAEQAEAARLFKVYRGGTDQSAREHAAGALVKMHVTVMLALVPILERDWLQAVNNYLVAVRQAAAEIARRRSADPAFGRELAALRATMANLRAAGAGLTKERLQAEGGPAMWRLREMHAITIADLVATQVSLGPAREAAAALTRMRAMLKKKTLLRDDRDYTEADFARDETASIAGGLRHNSPAGRILEANAATAAKNAVPAGEVEGIRDLNAMRMLLGLAPVLLDPGLCSAARGHSQDMAALKFFSHNSPVPGKASPSDRAKLAGTTGGAENIYSGNKDPHEANKGWFFSPGHHLNMFGNHRRAGMGRYEGHWTQLFGH